PAADGLPLPGDHPRGAHPPGGWPAPGPAAAREGLLHLRPAHHRAGHPGGPRGDLYVILNGWEEGGRQASFTLVWHPLISWMWWGAYIMAAGGLIAFGPTPQARSRGAARSTPPALPTGEGTGA